MCHPKSNFGIMQKTTQLLVMCHVQKPSVFRNFDRKTIMDVGQIKLSKTFRNFFESEKSSGILLIICTVVSLLLANSNIGANYLSIWQIHVGGLSVEQDR